MTAIASRSLGTAACLVDMLLGVADHLDALRPTLNGGSLTSGRRVTDTASGPAAEFRRFAVGAGTRVTALRCGDDQSCGADERADRVIVILFTPDCNSTVLARQFAAALAAGNRVECVLFGELDRHIVDLCEIVEEHAPVGIFSVFGQARSWVTDGASASIVITTSTCVFRNDRPWVRCSHDDLPATTAEIVRFYSDRASV